jgi:hypothetical protein
MSVNYRATWVPEQQDCDWDDAAAIAAGHVEQECADQGVQGCSSPTRPTVPRTIRASRGSSRGTACT